MPYIEAGDSLDFGNVYIVNYESHGQIAGYNLPHYRVKLSTETVIDIRARSAHKARQIAHEISELYDGEMI